MTLPSNDQSSKRIYGYSDRMPGISDTRDVLLMNPADVRRSGLRAGQMVSPDSDADEV